MLDEVGAATARAVYRADIIALVAKTLCLVPAQNFGAEIVTAVQTVILDGRSHSHAPFSRISDALQPVWKLDIDGCGEQHVHARAEHMDGEAGSPGCSMIGRRGETRRLFIC